MSNGFPPEIVHFEYAADGAYSHKALCGGSEGGYRGGVYTYSPWVARESKYVTCQKCLKIYLQNLEKDHNLYEKIVHYEGIGTTTFCGADDSEVNGTSDIVRGSRVSRDCEYVTCVGCLRLVIKDLMGTRAD